MSGSKGTVLIIDDDSRNIFALKAVLKARGYTVEFADDARKGIEMMKVKNDIFIVLLDMMMPGMDGYEALSVIRSTPAISRMPVISVTAQAMAGDREKCLAAGADEYISKPVNIDELEKHLVKYFDTKTSEGG